MPRSYSFRLLLALAVVGGGCFDKLSVDANKLACASEQNCPDGYVCIDKKGTPPLGRCVRSGTDQTDADQTEGSLVDASAADLAAPLDAGHNVDGEPDTSMVIDVGRDLVLVSRDGDWPDQPLGRLDADDSDSSVDTGTGPDGNGARDGGRTSTGGTAGPDGPGAGGIGGSGGVGGAGTYPGSGGITGSGGINGTGGGPGSGGITGSGGINGTGGGPGSGGITGSGGINGTGGGPGTGGIAGTGGTPGTGGIAGTGGTVGTGGIEGTGGITGSGGIAGSGGSGGSTGAGGVGTGGSSGACVAVSDFASWPSGKSPADIGGLAVNNFKPHISDPYSGVGYSWTFAYFGSLQLSKTVGDSGSNAALVAGFEPYASGTTAAPDNSASASVDTRSFGDLPLEIFIENQDLRCKALGLLRADVQWATTTADGITTDARYWSDDMYFITGLQAFAYRATGDSRYLDRAAMTMLAYLSKLQQSDGLFWHSRQSKAYWGRGNGWAAAGMTELLLVLPAGTTRDTIMAGYTRQMDGLLPLQIADGSDTGCWRQVLDLPLAAAESSCTALFTYALVTGVRNGWLTDAKYAKAAHDGWIALGNKTNDAGQLDQVCPGIGQAPAGTLVSQQQYYSGISLGSNDQHGQGVLLWAANALLRSDCPGRH